MPEDPLLIEGGAFRLFAVLHKPGDGRRETGDRISVASGPSPVSGPQAPVGAVLLAPFAEEKKGAHRLLVDVARDLCRRGIPVLRFDYRGTGDSEGSFTDFTLAGALEDTRRALAFLREQTGIASVSLLGVRLGATLAAQITQDADLNALVLWEPVVNGRRYLQMNLRQKRIREMMTAGEGSGGEKGGRGEGENGRSVNGSMGQRVSADCAASLPPSPLPPFAPSPPHSHTPTLPRPGQDLDGYWITPELNAEMDALTFPVPSLGSAPARVLGISVNAAGRVAREMENIGSAYTGTGSEVSLQAITAEPFWSLQDPIPVPELVNLTVEWLAAAGLAPPTVGGDWGGRTPDGSTDPGASTARHAPTDSTTATSAGTTHHSPLTTHSLAEDPIRFENQGRNLFGVLALPEAPGTPRTGIVTVHGWSGYRIGPTGVLVEFARQAATAGYPVLRFDFRGRGDSEGEPGEARRATMVDDTLQAMRFLRERAGCERILLAGICAGSQVAIGAAAAGGNPDGMLLWSAPVSEEKQEEQAVVAKRRHFAGEYARKLFRPETWRKLITGKLQPRKIARVLSGQAGRAADDDRTVDLRSAARLADFPGPILFVYGTNDPITGVALPYYQQILQARQDQVTVALVEGANHSFYGTAWKEQLLAHSMEWLRRVSGEW